jgi:tRNA (cytosine38-C5)-methyltransferase
VWIVSDLCAPLRIPHLSLLQTPYLVPESILQKPSSWCFDIVTADSLHTACFTKGYGRYIKGTGSILQFLPSPPLLEADQIEDEIPNMKRQKVEDSTDASLANLEHSSEHNSCHQTLEPLIGKLRYFTPEELLRLFGFDSPLGSPPGAFFPVDEKLTLRKKYELIGNSLNVTVASQLLRLLLVRRDCEVSV